MQCILFEKNRFLMFSNFKKLCAHISGLTNYKFSTKPSKYAKVRPEKQNLFVHISTYITYLKLLHRLLIKY